MPKRRQKKLKASSKKPEVKILSAKKGEEINSASVDDINEVESKNDEVDREKKLFMWVGVSCIMIIFFVAWMINLKNEFKVSLKKGAESGFNWSQTKVELDKAMAQVKQGLSEIKKIQADSKSGALSDEPELTREQINLLKGKLLDEAASSTASSTIK